MLATCKMPSAAATCQHPCPLCACHETSILPDPEAELRASLLKHITPEGLAAVREEWELKRVQYGWDDFAESLWLAEPHPVRE
jgi:hypothetical protein